MNKKIKYLDLVGETLLNGKVLDVIYGQTIRKCTPKLKMECVLCGKIYYSSLYTVISKRRKGSKGCGCLRKMKYIAGEICSPYWLTIQKRARTQNIEFSASAEYIWSLFVKQNRKCAYSGRDIKFAKSIKEYTSGENTASLDRIDSSKGYIEGNLQWLHKNVNKIKWDLSEEEFLSLCKDISNYRRLK